MAKQKMSIKKRASAVVAGVLAVALALGGAYAWTDYSQSARNTIKGTVAADVLLHDDFDGTNKDVYVENTGDNAVYVRVKFAEYLQIGNNSALVEFDKDPDDDADPTGKAQPDDVTTWPVHQFTNADAENKCGCSTHNYFKWNMSGAAKAYLAGVTEASSDGHGGLSQEQFDALGVDADVTIGDITTQKKNSSTAAAVMMLSDWLAETTKPTAACWLLDTDGWAYWSAALQPDTATNLLLDEVARVENSAPHDNWVYNIDVQLQAATVNEMDYWYADGVADVANPDNSVATVTAAGLDFIRYRAGDAISSADGTIMGANGVRYVSVANNVYGVAVMNADNTAYIPDANQSYVLAGQDGTVGNEDDNKLSGRIDKNGDSIDVATIVILADDGTAALADGTTITEAYYTIAGADADYYVTAGIDKKLGTYDDVIRSQSGALGAYDIDGLVGGDADKELMGWNYLGGKLENMLVATEYVLDNVKFNDDHNSETAYKYEGSVLANKINTIGTDMGITATVNPVDLDMSAAQHTGENVYVCTVTEDGHEHNVSSNCATMAYSKYYTTTGEQNNITGTKFFALSLTEVMDAYGDSTDAAIRKLRSVQAAPNWVRASNNSGTGNWYYAGWTDGDGNPIVTTNYWLRSPGYSASRAARINVTGYAYAVLLVTNTSVGARPACYMNLASVS